MQSQPPLAPDPYTLKHQDGSTVNISGEDIGNFFDAETGSSVDISGGSFGDFFEVLNGGTVNISGGQFRNSFDARRGSIVNLFTAEFSLNDVLIDDLILGQAFTILDPDEGLVLTNLFDSDEDLVLSGVFANGRRFDFKLNASDTSPFTSDLFESGSTLTLTLVPSGPSALSTVPEPRCGLTLATMSILLLIRRRRLAAH